MCQECPIESERTQSARFMEDLAEHFALMAEGKKHNVISTDTARNWSKAFVTAANALREAEKKVAAMYAALGLEYDPADHQSCPKSEAGGQ